MKKVTSALIGCLTLDGCSAALGVTIPGITWHFVDDNWRLKSVLIGTLNTGEASKSTEQLCYIVGEVMKNYVIFGSEK